MQWSAALRVAITFNPPGRNSFEPHIFNQAEVLLQLQSLEHSMSLFTLG